MPNLSTMRVLLSLLSAFLLPYLALALYRDEAYRIDFQHALLGPPLPRNTFFHRPASTSKASLLYTLSEKLLLGAVNPKDGALVWRQDLVERSEDRRALQGILRTASGSDTVVSAAGSRVQAWDAASGRLAWEWRAEGTVRGLEVLDRTGGAKDPLVLTQEGDNAPRVARLRADDGSTVWGFDQSMY